MISRRARIFRAATGKYFSSIDPRRADVQKLRRRLHKWAGIMGTARGVEVRPDRVHGLAAEWLRPANAA